MTEREARRKSHSALRKRLNSAAISYRLTALPREAPEGAIRDVKEFQAIIFTVKNHPRGILGT